MTHSRDFPINAYRVVLRTAQPRSLAAAPLGGVGDVNSFLGSLSVNHNNPTNLIRRALSEATAAAAVCCGLSLSHHHVALALQRLQSANILACIRGAS
jgi:hypothetical protein